MKRVHRAVINWLCLHFFWLEPALGVLKFSGPRFDIQCVAEEQAVACIFKFSRSLTRKTEKTDVSIAFETSSPDRGLGFKSPAQITFCQDNHARSKSKNCLEQLFRGMVQTRAMNAAQNSRLLHLRLFHNSAQIRPICILSKQACAPFQSCLVNPTLVECNLIGAAQL